MTPLRPDSTELSDTRRRVDTLVSRLPRGGTADQAFEKPWQLRAFAIAVVAYNGGHYEWSEFQLSLAESIRRWEDGGGEVPWSYYAHWLSALEDVLDPDNLDSLDARTQTVLETPANRNHHEAHWKPVAISPARTDGRASEL
jgi:nitrile hydratase accessory protein